MPMVTDRLKEGKLVTMEFQDAYARTASIQGLLSHFQRVSRNMGRHDLAKDCTDALTGLQDLLSELTFNP